MIAQIDARLLLSASMGARGSRTASNWALNTSQKVSGIKGESTALSL